VPGHLVINEGTEVMWQIEDTTQERKRFHDISFEALNEESAPMKTKNDSFKLKFEKKGVYKYRCSIQTRMHGIIEVVGNSTPNNSPPINIRELS